jgi:hypothetical protein
MTDLGKVGMRARGDWNSSTAYEVLDVVTYNNGLYIAKQAVPANTAPTNTTYWQLAVNGSTEIVTLTNAITFTSNAQESFDFADYKDYYLLAVYTNNMTALVLGSTVVSAYNFNKQTGALTITKTSGDAWSGNKGTVVFVKSLL